MAGAVPTLVLHDDKSTRPSRDDDEEEGAQELPWTPTAVAKVCHLETVHRVGGGHEVDGGASGDDGAGKGGSTDKLTDGLGIARLILFDGRSGERYAEN